MKMQKAFKLLLKPGARTAFAHRGGWDIDAYVYWDGIEFRFCNPVQDRAYNITEVDLLADDWEVQNV